MATTHDVLGDLALSRPALDRSAHERTDPHLLGRLLADDATRTVVVRADRMQVTTTGDVRLVVRPPHRDDPDRLGVFLGRDAGRTAYVAVVDEGLAGDDVVGTEPVPGVEQTEWTTLRRVGALLPDTDAGVFTTALALANWHRAHPCCSRCGALTVPEQAGWIRRCPEDGSEHYPRTDPAVIMSVIDPTERLLLGQAPGWPERQFSVLAGFVEPGESLESAVAREVEEEVGIVVDEVRYLGNQPWPFPSSLMVGFEAHVTQVALTLDPREIQAAMWVTRDEYRARLRSGEVRVPTGISISRRIIEHWLGATVESVTGD